MKRRGNMVIVSVYLPPQLYSQLRELVAKQGLSMSEFIRYLIMREIEKGD